MSISAICEPPYAEEFKIDDLWQVAGPANRVAEVASLFGMTTHSLYAWKLKYGPNAAAHEQKTPT